MYCHQYQTSSYYAKSKTWTRWLATFLINWLIKGLNSPYIVSSNGLGSLWRRETTASSESPLVPAAGVGSLISLVWSCSYSEGWPVGQKGKISHLDEIIISYVTPPLCTMQKYPGPKTRGNFRRKESSGADSLIIICLSLSLMSYQGQRQRATVGPLDSWKDLPIKHLTKRDLFRCVECW